VRVSRPGASKPAPRPVGDINATSDALPAISQPALPFGSTPAPEFVAAMNAPVQPKPPAERDPRDRTSFLPAISDADLADATVEAPSVGPAQLAQQSAPPRPTGNPRLTLEQYASLNAELAVCGTGRIGVLNRYGLADEWARKHEDQQWALQMYK